MRDNFEKRRKVTNIAEREIIGTKSQVQVFIYICVLCRIQYSHQSEDDICHRLHTWPQLFVKKVELGL